jgi:hypothetical protein
MILMRATKPQYSSYSRSCKLNFEGRIPRSSRKNIQIEYKSRMDGKIRTALQHCAVGGRSDLGEDLGKNSKLYALDFTYPFSQLQAFAFALGIYNFSE